MHNIYYNIYYCIIKVYGPGDLLFFPPFVKNAEEGRLRVMGNGQNLCSFTYVDNICHALMLGEKKIDKFPNIRGEFFVCTDGEKTNMWKTIDDALVKIGFESLFSKTKIPAGLVLALAYIL
jgi:nucleoside-diphosphate-sugar epimerase